MRLEKHIRKSTATLLLVRVMALSAMLVSAATHSSDVWNRGIRAYYIIFGYQQYSEFTCGEQSHSATVRIRYIGQSNYEQHRVTAAAGKTAKAHLEFGSTSELDTRRSYYSHL